MEAIFKVNYGEFFQGLFFTKERKGTSEMAILYISGLVNFISIKVSTEINRI